MLILLVAFAIQPSLAFPQTRNKLTLSGEVEDSNGKFRLYLANESEREFRGRGLSTACASALCGDIIARGHTPSWSTSTDNVASIRVAEKLGFTLQRHDLLYLVGVPFP